MVVKCCSDVDIGKIEPTEVKEALLRLGVNIDLAEAKRLTQRFVCC